MTMTLWVDNDNYFGPDRRRRSAGSRLLDRRRADRAGAPPPLATAMRQLYLRVLDAHGGGRDAFVTRLEGTALLADMNNEQDAAFELANLSISLDRSCIEDARANIYATLDRAQAAIKAA